MKVQSNRLGVSSFLYSLFIGPYTTNISFPKNTFYFWHGKSISSNFLPPGGTVFNLSAIFMYIYMVPIVIFDPCYYVGFFPTGMTTAATVLEEGSTLPVSPVLVGSARRITPTMTSPTQGSLTWSCSLDSFLTTISH